MPTLTPMPTLFTRIINREIPGRFVYEDEHCVAFLTVAPLRPGHTLVVPKLEIDHWVDLPPVLLSHLMIAAQKVAQAIQQAFPSVKVGMVIVGLEVPHCHIHLSPIDHIGDLNFENQNFQARPEDLDAAAEAIRSAMAGT